MTTTPDADAGLVRAFPTPGPLLGTAYRDLYLAAEGSDNQKATIGDPNLLPKPWDPPTCVLRQGSCRISGFESDHTVGSG